MAASAAVYCDWSDWARQQEFKLLIVYPSARAVPFYQREGFKGQPEVLELKLRDYYSARRAGPL
ncbi:MAG: hypothetical protein R3300_04220 [Candidatus Promineifilaceae bacterium]|nr:hypothetical protein [Candidatus Promineifilaceae bacterium]